ncbi:ABC transporter permease, partial [Actinoplanes sp. NPDC049596]
MRNLLPAIHWASVRGRARAGAGPLALVAAVVLVITLLAAAVPPLRESTADDAARDAVRKAGSDATVQASSPWGDDYGPTGGRIRDENLADSMNDLADQAESQLDPGLRAVLRPPVITATSVPFKVVEGTAPRSFQLAYARDNVGGPAVTWVAGHAPGATVDGPKEIPLNGPLWETQVGLSESVAAELGLRPGDHVPVEDELRNKYNVLVSGIFRPVRADDPAWSTIPWVVRPVPALSSVGSTRVGGLLSNESLPDARLALQAEQLRRTAWYAPDPDRLSWESAQRLAGTVASLKAGSASSGDRDTSLRWNTQLDSVLTDVRAQIDAASAQASVLLIAVLAGAVLVLLLAADLLVRRRAGALITARQRGAGLPGLATELVIESVSVTVPAAAIGLVGAYALTGGAALGWAAPVVLGAIVAGPLLGTLTAARATRD